MDDKPAAENKPVIEDSPKASKLRIALWIGVVTMAVGSVALYAGLHARREAVREAKTRPETRAEAALRAADRAVARGALDEAVTAYLRAAQVLDEGLSAPSPSATLQRARLTVSERLGRIAMQRGRAREAAGHLADAAERATRLFDGARTDGRNRMVRLATVLTLDDARRDMGGDAADAIAAAVEDVEESLAVLAPSESVRAMLADAWTRLARHRKSVDAFDRAVAHADARTEAAEDPLAAVRDHYAIVVEAAEMATREADLDRYEREALRLLRQQLALQPDDASLRKAQSAWHARRAKRAGDRGDVASARREFALALELRRALAASGDHEARRDLVVTLTQAASFESKADDGADTAITQYREAAEIASASGDGGRSMRARALGSAAQVLGRVDRMSEAKAAAAAAYALASAEADVRADDVRAGLDAAVAALRHARLLRAKPEPDRAEARRVLQVGRARLKALEATDTSERDAKRRAKLHSGFDALAKDLGG